MSDVKENFLDKFIGFFSPETRLNRIKSKKTADFLSQRKYEGASRGRRTKNWCAPSTSANAANANSLKTLRNRARDLVRNNPYAAKGIQVIQSELVGRGIRTQFKAGARTRERRINELWKQWAMSTEIDYDGRNNIFGMQSIIARAIAESGEVLIRRRFVPGSKFPLKLQILEGDYIDSGLLNQSTSTGNRVRHGIEFDDQGRRVAYYLFENHPGDTDTLIKSNFRTNRVDASEILHIYRQDRPGQIRGVSWLAPIMIRLRDFDEYEDADLVKQKTNAMFTAFIRDIEAVPKDITDAQEEELGESLEPGMIEILPSGKDIIFSNPPNNPNYQQYTKTILHSIATGLGITYEALTGDLSEVNFSSARLGKTQMNRSVDMWRMDLIINQFMDPAVKWFLNFADIIGNNVSDVDVKHTPPRKELVDPTKEIPALNKAVRSGMLSLSDVIRSMGQDPDEQMAEIASDNEKLDELGLTLDSDPRKTNASGSQQDGQESVEGTNGD